VKFREGREALYLSESGMKNISNTHLISGLENKNKMQLDLFLRPISVRINTKLTTRPKDS
jgi:hypothetical protein